MNWGPAPKEQTMFYREPGDYAAEEREVVPHG